MSWLQDCSPHVLRALQWTLGSEEGRRSALHRCHTGGSALLLTQSPEVEAAQEPKAKKRRGRQRLQRKAGQSPLHWLCANDTLEANDALGGWSCRRVECGVASLARALIRQWPEALVMADGRGMVPLSYLSEDFCQECLPMSSPMELLLTLLEGLRGLLLKQPELLHRLDEEALGSLKQVLTRVGWPADLQQVRGQRRVWRAVALELVEQRRDARFWEQREQEVLHRLKALPRRDVRAPKVSAETWKERQAQYEERLGELRRELGSVRPPSTVTVPEEPAAPLEAPETSLPTCEAEALVSSLRRQRLAGGSMREALGAAVERLALDLYEMESHFVYELLQNADDNRYEGEAYLRLELHENFFMSVNNELGLTPQDVRAICDVNASSKKGLSVTGHKGIGWKSCFQVSDCPHVLSKAFRLKFDVARRGSMGYVTPDWVNEQELLALPSGVREAYAQNLTVIYLPLRAGTHEGVELALADVEEHLCSLLFFRRLRVLELRSGRGLRRLSARGSEVVREGEAPAVHRYVLHRHSLLVEGQELAMTLAFPEAEEKPPPQALYCLLPVRCVGFCFALDAPWELVASRGDVHEGSRRNQALVEALPEAFAAALAAHPSLTPRALAWLGQVGASALWQAAHARLLQQLHGTRCALLEDGSLEVPEKCLLRPSGAGLPASQLVPSELLWRSCGRRFAQAKNLGLEVMSLEHWLLLLRHRDEQWPQGLCGGFARDEELVDFQKLYAFFDELLENEELEVHALWDLELLPIETVDGKALASPSSSPFRGSLLPCWAERQLRTALPWLEEGLAPGRFQGLATAEGEVFTVGKMLQREQRKEVAWAALAVLQKAFVEGSVPSEGWSSYGEALLLPCLQGSALAPRCVAPSALGARLRAPQAAQAALAPWRYLDTRYLELGHAGHACAWEAFFEALGARALRAGVATCHVAPAQALPEALPRVEAAQNSRELRRLEALARQPLAEQMVKLFRPQVTGKVLVCAEALDATGVAERLLQSSWWENLEEPVFQYVTSRSDAWLSRQVVGTPARPLEEHLLPGSELHQLLGPFLPAAQLPETRTRQVEEHLRGVGLMAEATAPQLVRALQAVAGRCQDLGLYVSLYQRLQRLEVVEDSLKELIFVPGHGMVKTCAWKEDVLLQLAEVPALAGFYERQGLEKYFSRLVPQELRWTPALLLKALRRLVRRVDEGESAVPGSEGLEKMLAMCQRIYLALAGCLKDSPSELDELRRCFRQEQLIVLLPDSGPKRLSAVEAWWRASAELEQASVTALSLQQFYAAELEAFFVQMGVNQEMDRGTLRALLQRPNQPLLSKWSGLQIGDIEDLGLAQTSSNFRPADWRAPDETPELGEPAEPAEPAAPTPTPAPGSDFRPPPSRTGHVPAMRFEEPRPAPKAAGSEERSTANGQEEEHGEEDLAELQQRLLELSTQSRKRQQESYELRTRWAQAEDDVERYRKILEQFWQADASLPGAP